MDSIIINTFLHKLLQGNIVSVDLFQIKRGQLKHNQSKTGKLRLSMSFGGRNICHTFQPLFWGKKKHKTKEKANSQKSNQSQHAASGTLEPISTDPLCSQLSNDYQQHQLLSLELLGQKAVYNVLLAVQNFIKCTASYPKG